VNANCGIVGISMDMQTSRIKLSEGYDGSIHDHWMTKEERQALAVWAIDLWKKYAEQEELND
jgi:hypothetical protein